MNGKVCIYVATQNDALIMVLKDKIEKKKKKLGSKVKFEPKTTCIIELFGEKINIHTLRIGSIEPYLLMLKSMVDACDYSPVSSTSCIMSGFTLEDWYNDFVSKYNSLKYADDAAELVKLEKKLDAMLSNDKKIELEIEEISKLLGD